MTQVLMDKFLLLMVTATVTSALIFDVWQKRIPNLVTFPAAFIGILYHGIIGGFDGILLSFAGVAVGLSVFLIPYSMGGMGAGDVKLMGAVGAVLGPSEAFHAILFSAIIGAGYALILLIIYYDTGKDFFQRTVIVIRTLLTTGVFVSVPSRISSEQQPVLRYGVAIALGTFSSLAWKFYC